MSCVLESFKPQLKTNWMSFSRSDANFNFFKPTGLNIKPQVIICIIRINTLLGTGNILKVVDEDKKKRNYDK